MGNPRKPTRLKVIQGTAQPCRMNPNEPQVPLGTPEAPKHLSQRASEVWPDVCALLTGMGVLTIADGMAVEGLCESYADLITAREALAERDGLTYEATTEGGATMIRPYPEVTMVSDADKRFKAWLSVFGLTPSDRSKVSTTTKKSSNKFLAAAGQ